MGTTPFDRKKYSRGQEEADVFLEAILPPLRLIVFGAGPDAVPLVDTAKLLGWHVTVIDRRPAYASPPRLPCADEVLISEGLPPGLAITDRHAAVIMTHHYLTDRALLPALLESPARYVGLLGPREKRQRLLRDLQGAGFTPSRSQLDRLYAPVGLDIGAETPEEIALSVVAEIAAVVGGRSGGSLRRRPGRIHEVPG